MVICNYLNLHLYNSLFLYQYFKLVECISKYTTNEKNYAKTKDNENNYMESNDNELFYIPKDSVQVLDELKPGLIYVKTPVSNKKVIVSVTVKYHKIFIIIKTIFKIHYFH